MARMTPAARAVHAAADPLEPKLSRACARSIEKARAAVSVNRLAMALSAGDVKGAVRLVSRAQVEEALGPAATIVRDATLRGGRVGAGIVNEALGV